MNITVLTGAGISVESGMRSFRSEDGLWEGSRVEDVATYDGFLFNKNLVHQFYNTLRSKLKTFSPNSAHIALARLEQEWKNGFVHIITQNIDDLHEKAGSKNIIHMHGQLNSQLCESCSKRKPNFDDIDADTKCSFCGNKKLRPDIVWFGEVPYEMDKISDILRQTDLLLVIGTSGVVYPAAGFASFTRTNGAYNIEFNIEKSKISTDFQHAIYGKAGETVPKFIEQLLKHKDLSFLSNDEPVYV